MSKLDLIALGNTEEDLQLLRDFISSLNEEKKYWEFPFDIGTERIAPTPENLWTLNQKNQIKLILAKEGNKVLGFVFLIRNCQFPFIPSLSIIVKQEEQGKGIGKILIKELQRIAREEKLKGIYCGCLKENENALQFYYKLGFIKEGEKTKDRQIVYELRWWNVEERKEISE